MAALQTKESPKCVNGKHGNDNRKRQTEAVIDCTHAEQQYGNKAVFACVCVQVCACLCVCLQAARQSRAEKLRCGFPYTFIVCVCVYVCVSAVGFGWEAWVLKTVMHICEHYIVLHA